MSLKPDDLLSDRYDIREIVKTGGMGAVYKAYDLRLEGLCAVKEMRADAPAEDADWVSRRFREEATILGLINHPDVPHVRDFFRIGRLSYIVMDFVDGVSLEAELLANPKGLPQERVWEDALVVLGILDYLQALHPPVIHRDIKPANIIREAETGRVKLVDFGLARAPSENTMTMAGTFHYCSPEQLHGKATPQSDLFSLGVTLYQLLSGEIPLLGYAEPLARQVPGVDPRLARAIEKAISPDAKERPASARAMLTMLARTQKAATPPPAFPRLLLAVGAVAVLLLTGLNLVPDSPARPPTPAPTAAAAEPMLVNTTAQPTIFRRQTVRVEEVSRTFTAMVERLYKEAGQHPAYARYHVWNPPQVDLEVGLVLPSPLPHGGSLPATRAARLVYRGAYEHLPEAYLELQKWLSSQKLTAGQGPWAIYVDTNVTEIYWPLEP